jgi:hypothetical protein
MSSMIRGWLNWQWYFEAQLRERVHAEWTAFVIIAVAALLVL